METKLEFFCGTGGVGKTTLSATRALHLTHKDKKVLLMTIDPSKRLRQLFNLEQGPTHEKTKFNINQYHSLDILLMTPEATFSKIIKNTKHEKLKDNEILKTLTKPSGGLNELLSLIEIYYQVKSKKYDVIIVDTAPGKHFIDFLKAGEKLNGFFDQQIIETFLNLGEKNNLSSLFHLPKLILGTGIKKVLGYLQTITGEAFIEQFTATITGLYQLKEHLNEAVLLSESLKRGENSTWFLVTSAEQQKIQEALEFTRDPSFSTLRKKTICLINKSQRQNLENWQPDPRDISLNLVRKSMLDRENTLKIMASKSFDTAFEFSEILEPELDQQMQALTQQWLNIELPS